VFRRAIEAIIHFATEQHKSIFSPSEAADIKSVMQSYGETTDIIGRLIGSDVESICN